LNGKKAGREGFERGLEKGPAFGLGGKIHEFIWPRQGVQLINTR
jgi:hypothetical protein